MKKNEFKQDNKGFSLVEIIIVIAVMAILTGFIAPQVMTYVEQSREAKDLQLANTIFSAVQGAIAINQPSADFSGDIENAISKADKLDNLLGTDMDTTVEIRTKTKSKAGKAGTLFVKYNSTNGNIDVYFSTAVDAAATIGPVRNY